ncbi:MULTISPECIES: helicase-exonuclease AddAB subunit AddA [unclassified Granulicatella]|uniref:helicase-exonuclease AddAB subunit AddA n=1 Tax=unclassified Granulicatella TaxID=2630493 RepID=UPI0010746099|nr:MULTISPECIES: helicase-exonuclease AddAB subunit AddA [unclassified Granulicatella]MBF0779585.1 helicase-exonuclease AddAB subunit AddA [Granulicatella sp. 19428wC4_WM01]TFU96386.1 helicase-exonuclease AddAB subunit AddA [Granulicatella sp. WM01]
MIPIKPSNVKFTDAQWRAIFQEGQNILVSASAGSGKTTVLTQRIVEKLKKGVSIEQLVVVTYTQAAALEMKERLERVIKEEINQSVDDTIKRHLQMQISLLPQAYISTIHAFCLKLIRQYFYLVHLDPNCRLMSDDTEIALFKEDVWLQLKEKLYQEDSFIQLAKAYSSDKYDDSLTELVFSLHAFALSNEYPDKWLNHLSDLYTIQELGSSQLFQELIRPNVQAVIEESIAQLEYAIHFLKGESTLQKSVEILEQDYQHIYLIQQKLNQQSNFDDIYEAVQNVNFERWKGAGKKDDDTLKDLANKAKKIRDTIKDTITHLQKQIFNGTQDRQLELLHQQAPFIEEVVRVVKLFSERYTQAKREASVLEFSDLEHLTLDILAPIQKDGTRYESAIAKEFKEQFNEIMVDEYQDVNRLQEAILSYLTNGNNLFMVGDVKQSIYSFRLATPSLFLEKYIAYGQKSGGERIILAENFRSRGSVLQGVNFIFKQIMDKQVGDMLYDQDAMLVQGNMSFEQDEQYPLTVLLYEKEQTTPQRELLGDVDERFMIDSKAEGEITMVAHKINELIQQQVLIQDNGQKRPVTYQDIVLLVPTRKHNVIIQEIFERYTIPIFVSQADTYFQRTEVMIMMSVLRIIDNPYQDIPVVSVLRSPIVQLDENELAAIRINERTGNYFHAVLQFVNHYREKSIVQNDFHHHIYDKLCVFLERLEKWRFMAHKESLVALIWTIYQDTQFLDYVLTLPSGKQRQANLHALYEHAKSYEQTQFKGLFQFVRFIEKMQEKDNDLAEVSHIAHSENAVQLMTIHASKGLEFPIVFIMDMGKSFNKQELHKPYIFTEEYGFGSDYFNHEYKWRYPTLARIGMMQFKEKKMLAEEMRKLYVALTRAKEQLFLVGSCQNEKEYWESLEMIQEHKPITLPVASRLQSQSLLGWVSMALMRHRCANNKYLVEKHYPTELAHFPVQYTLSFYTNDALKNVLKGDAVKTTIQEWMNQQNEHFKQESIEKLIYQMHYHYPYEAATRTTSYQSVSELKRMIEDPDVLQMEMLGSNRYVVKEFKKPKFMEHAQEVNGATLGNAIHLFMQTIPLEEQITWNSIEQHIQWLVSNQLLSTQIGEKLSREQLFHFFSSSFGQYMIAHAKHVSREVPFSLVVKASQLFPNELHLDEKVLVHGIVDGYIETDEGIVLYDFKTDNVTHKNARNVLIERYTNQLSVYANALEAILEKPVKHVYICALSVNETISIEWKKWKV